MPFDLEDLRARLRVDLSELRRARVAVREEIRRIKAAAAGDPITLRFDTDARQLLAETSRARRAAQFAADRNPIEVRTRIDARQLYALAQSLRDLRTVYSATLGPVRDFGRTVATTAVVAGGASAGLVGAAGLSGGLLAVAAAASQAAGALPLAVTGMAAVAVVSGTARVAMLGVADAIGDKLAPITEHLSRNAQALVDRIGGLVPVLTRVKNAIQDAGFAGLADVVRPLAEQYLPLLRRTGVGLAQTVNVTLRGAIRSLRTESAQLDLGRVLGAASSAAVELAPVLQRIPRLLLGIAAAAAPAFRDLTEMAGEAASAIVNRLQRGLDTGTLAASIERGVAALAHLAGTAAAVASSIRSVVRAATTAFGGDLLLAINRAATHMAIFLRSVQGQQALKAFFTATVPVLRGLAEIARILAPLLASLAPVILELAQAFTTALIPVVPVAAELARTLGQALAAVLPAVSAVAVAIGGALTQALQILAPVLPPLLTAITGLLSPTGLLAAVLRALAPVLPILTQGLASVVTILAGAFTTAVNALAPVLPDLANAVAALAVALAQGLSRALISIAPYLPDIVVGFADLLVALTPLIPIIADLVVQTLPLTIQILPPLLRLLTTIAPAVVFLARVFSVLMIPSLILFRLWTGLVAGMLNVLKTAIDGTVAGVTIAVQWFGVFAGVLRGAFSDAIARVKGLFVAAWNAMQNAAITAAQGVLTVISLILGGISGLLGALGRLPGPFGAPFRAGKEAVDRARGSVETLKNRIDGLRPKVVDVTVNIRGREVIATAPTAGRAGMLAYGGWVDGPWLGPRADNRWARVNPREFVIQAPAAIELERRYPGLLAGFLNRFHELGPLGGDPSGAWFGRAPRFATGGSVGYVQSRLRATDPLPYVWGATGPGGFDCSGLVGYAYALSRGLAPFRRYFTTATFPGFDGFRPGAVRGGFNVGVNPGSHMAGNYAGLPFEAQSTATGIRVGAGVTPVSAFRQQWHLPGIVAALTAVQLRSVMAQVRPAILAAIMRDLGVRRADAGITLATGLNVVENATGGPEPLIRADGPIRLHPDTVDAIVRGIGSVVVRGGRA